MLRALVLALSGVLVSSAPSRETRQAAGCLSAFQNVPNVCSHNPSGQTFFPHPGDPTKFLQCDIYNRMYIIQCPQGEVFHLLTTSCQPSQLPVTTQPPIIITQPPQTTPPPVTTTQAPVITSVPVVGRNPCTPQAIAYGQLYVPFPEDRTKFYECDVQGHATVIDCPALMVWDETILSCVYSLGAGQPKPTPQILPDQPDNPCTQKAVSEGRLFFAHPDQTKYVQCDLTRNAFINSCPTHLMWNAFLETCYNPAPSGRK